MKDGKDLIELDLKEVVPTGKIDDTESRSLEDIFGYMGIPLWGPKKLTHTYSIEAEIKVSRKSAGVVFCPSYTAEFDKADAKRWYKEEYRALVGVEPKLQEWGDRPPHLYTLRWVEHIFVAFFQAHTKED